jgi:CTP synthase
VQKLAQYHGVLVPGGFGARGVEGKIAAIRFCREQKIPYFGLCYGMQLATIEFARNVCGLRGANTTEVNAKTKYPVITTMAEQEDNIANGDMGGSMRLGSYECDLAEGSVSQAAYGTGRISERHRHRYEFNNQYRMQLEGKGLRIAGINPKRNLVEIIELPDHPFFVGVQFHPEFKGRPLDPHPLFVAFVKAAYQRSSPKA